jgi:proteasome accessory factor B
VRFVYHSLGKGKGRSKARERDLDPFGLYFERGAWYVVGYCHLRKQIRSFRVSRIESAVELAYPGEAGPDFERPVDFKLQDYSRILPWEFEEGSEYEARVLFSPRIAWQVERDLGDVYRFEPAGDGSGILHVTVRNQDAFLSWILSFAEDAEVLSPSQLRNRVKERLAMMMDKLGGGAGA